MTAAKLSQAAVAAQSGLNQSTVSRILSGDFTPESESLAKLLDALPNKSDRQHCLREYLLDHTPEDYRHALVLHFGQVEDDRPRPTDALSRALHALETRATDDQDLRELLLSLSRCFEKSPTRVEESQASYGSSVDELLAQRVEPTRGVVPKTGGTSRAGSAKAKRGPGSKR